MVVVDGDGDRATHPFRCVERPLQRLHATERTADDGCHERDADCVERSALRAHDIGNRYFRKVRSCRWPGRTVAAAEHVDADDASLSGIEQRTVAHDAWPPFRGATRPREPMCHEDDV